MGARFSTADVGPNRQFHYFRETICEAVIRLGARRRHVGPFGAEIRTHDFGPLRFIDVRCDPVTIERSPSHIAHESRGSFFVTLQVAGTGVVQQRRREARLTPGEFTVLDSAEPYVLRFDAPVRRLVVEVPREELQRRAGLASDLRGVAFDRRRPGAQLAFQVLSALHRESAEPSTGAETRLAARALDLVVAAMLGGQGFRRSAGPIRAGCWRRCRSMPGRT